MSNKLPRTRKTSDEELIRLNSLGLSLATIAQILKCHPTSVTLRLKALKVPSADTRRSFMEDILKELPEEFKDEIADYLVNQQNLSIKQYIKALVYEDVSNRRLTSQGISNALG
jgi:DNA-binding transcriptional MerR regulator